MTNVPISTSTLELPKRPVVLWDLVLTLVLLLGGFVTAIVIGVGAVGLGFAPGESCSDCADAQIFFGVALAMFGPPVIYVLAIIIAVIRLIKRQIAFWVPIVGILGGVGLWATGAALVFTGIPGFTFG